MKRPTQRAAIAVAAVVVVAALGAGAWWFDARTKPDAVARRIAAQIADRHAGASVVSLGKDLLRVTTPSGVYIDTRLASVFQECRDDRFVCSKAIDRVALDVERAEAMVASPRLADLRAMVIGETSPGFRFGFVTEPLIGPLEVRYALVAGAASTFVTSTIADRLGANRVQLKQAALANLAADGEPRAELLSDSPGVYRAISKDDPVANLLDASRMRKLATLVGSNRIYCAVPERGVLLLARADHAGKQALTTLLSQERTGGSPGEPRPGEAELFVYDKAAAEGQSLMVAKAGL